MSASCVRCGTPVSQRSTTRQCRSCWAKSPERRAKVSAAAKRNWQDPETRRVYTEATTKTLARPDVAAKRIEGVKRNQTWLKASQCITPEHRAKAAKHRSDTVLAHIPPDVRTLYKSLRRSKRLTAQEAAEIVTSHHEAQTRKFVRSLTTKETAK